MRIVLLGLALVATASGAGYYTYCAKTCGGDEVCHGEIAPTSTVTAAPQGGGPPGCWEGNCTIGVCRAEIPKQAGEDTMAALTRHLRDAHASGTDGKPSAKEVRDRFADAEWLAYDADEKRLTIKTGGKTVELDVDGDRIIRTLEKIEVATLPAEVKKGLDAAFGGYSSSGAWVVTGDPKTYRVRFGRDTAECQSHTDANGKETLVRARVHREHLAVLDASGRVLEERVLEPSHRGPRKRPAE